MTNNEHLTMIVWWKEQRRPIKIKINDDINVLEKAIINAYQLQQRNSLNEYQIQYYDNVHERFIDLYSETLDLFQQLVHRLLSPEAPLKSSKEWTLKIVSKAVETTRHTLHESITDDTYSYQQENDATELLQNQDVLSLTDNQTNNTQPSLVSYETNDDSPANLPRVPILQNNDEDQQEITRPNHQSPRLNTNFELVNTSDHPYGLAFDGDLADHQRLQFESDMIRNKDSSKKTIGGCLLRAAPKSDATSSDDNYPSVHFKIPPDKVHLNWLLYTYVLTEPDNNGIHYLHASKGIFDNHTKREDKFGIIPNSDAVNPYVVQLCQNDVRDGRHELYVKVCNIKNLPARKHERLREFPRLNDPIIYDDKKLLSTKTTVNLKFSSDKYHLGCILVFESTSCDRCISSLTTTENNRKRQDSDKTTQQDDKRNFIRNRFKQNDIFEFIYEYCLNAILWTGWSVLDNTYSMKIILNIDTRLL